MSAVSAPVGRSNLHIAEVDSNLCDKLLVCGAQLEMDHAHDTSNRPTFKFKIPSKRADS